MTLGSDRARALTRMTTRLTDRLARECEAFEAHRAQDVAGGMAETQDLANAYRRESVALKADPSLLKDAPAADRMELIRATEAFEAVLARHARAVETARIVSEGLVQTIAQEVAAARASGAGYGANGAAAAGDGRAVAFNRMA